LKRLGGGKANQKAEEKKAEPQPAGKGCLKRTKFGGKGLKVLQGRLNWLKQARNRKGNGKGRASPPQVIIPKKKKKNF